MTADVYLAGLRLEGCRVLVVGGGGVAQRRLPGLLAAGAVVDLVAPSAGPTIEAWADAGRLRLHARPFDDRDVDGAWYVLAATDRPEVNERVATLARRARIFCVRADDAPAGTAITPATGRHEGVEVAVYGGRDPRRAVGVRDAVLDLLRDGTISAPPVRAGAGGSPSGPAGAPGLPGVALVGAGPGDPDLITVRGRECVARADVLVVDRLAPQELLALARPDAEIVDAAKLPRGRAMAQETINAVLVGRALDGRFVVRLKGGDPFVFGRGFEELQACLAAGVPVAVVPGVSSAFAVPGVAGVPVTHRDHAQEVVVASGHVPPGDPRSTVDWTAVGALRGSVVLLMAVENLAAIAEALIAGGRSPETPVALVQNGTTATERTVRATLATAGAVARAEAVRPPAIVVVGAVAGLPDALAGPRGALAGLGALAGRGAVSARTAAGPVPPAPR